jgi:hypothetical protein
MYEFRDSKPFSGGGRLSMFRVELLRTFKSFIRSFKSPKLIEKLLKAQKKLEGAKAQISFWN